MDAYLLVHQFFFLITCIKYRQLFFYIGIFGVWEWLTEYPLYQVNPFRDTGFLYTSYIVERIEFVSRDATVHQNLFK